MYKKIGIKFKEKKTLELKIRKYKKLKWLPKFGNISIQIVFRRTKIQ